MEHDKYLFVKCHKIFIPNYIVKRVFAYNDFDNEYYYKYDSTAKELFDKYNIPKKYRKIVLVIRNNCVKKMELFDFITGIAFDYNKYIDENNNQFIFGKTKFIQLDSPYHVKIDPPYTLRDASEIKDFFDELKENNLLENYLKAIRKLYLVSIYKDLNVNTKIEDMTLTRRQIRKKNKNE